MNSSVQHAVDAEGIGWITFNDPQRKVNLLDSAAMAQLRGAIDALAAAPVKAVIVTSAKEKIFIAGADLKWLATLADAPAAIEVSRKGQRIFEALNALPVPTICAIDGSCAGGGLELALACQWRIATNAPHTRIGLCSTGVGVIPGWGGCIRLPRLIGPRAALDHILNAELLSGEEALAAGIVDELVPSDQLRERALEAARRFSEDGSFVRIAPQPAASSLWTECRRPTGDKALEAAPKAAIDVIERTDRMQARPALDIEAEAFGRIAATPTAKAYIRDFFRKVD